MIGRLSVKVAWAIWGLLLGVAVSAPGMAGAATASGIASGTFQCGYSLVGADSSGNLTITCNTAVTSPMAGLYDATDNTLLTSGKTCANASTYNYTNATVDNAGNIKIYVSGCTAAATVKPGKPTNVQATQVSDANVMPAAVSVQFTRADAQASDFVAICEQNATSAKFGYRSGSGSPLIVDVLEAGQGYRCKVMARNSVGESDFSDFSPSVVPGSPGLPTGVTAVVVANASPAIIVNFKRPTLVDGVNIDKYQAVCRSGTDGVWSTKDVTKSASETSDTAYSATITEGLVAGSSYQCGAAAHNGAGWGNVAWNDGQVIVPGLGNKPGQLVEVSHFTKLTGNSRIKFTFMPSGGIAQYRAICKRGTVVHYGDGSAATANNTDIVVGSLDNALTYECTVAARNAAGWGPESAALSIQPRLNEQSIGDISLPSPLPAKVGQSGTPLSATAGSGLPVTFAGTANVCTVSGTTVKADGVGECTITAKQSGDNAYYSAAPDKTAVFRIDQKAEQTIAFDPVPSIKRGGTGTVSAKATSGLTVDFSSQTTSICTVSGSTISGVAAGICTIAANQPGNTNYAQAPQVTSSFSIANTTEPGAPTITSIQPGPGKATINFTAPSNPGDAPITSYTASCTASGKPTRSASGSGSPLTVVGMTGDVTYTCTVTASNGLTGAASAAVTVKPTQGKKGNLTPILMLLLD